MIQQSVQVYRRSEGGQGTQEPPSAGRRANLRQTCQLPPFLLFLHFEKGTHGLRRSGKICVICEICGLRSL